MDTEKFMAYFDEAAEKLCRDAAASGKVPTMRQLFIDSVAIAVARTIADNIPELPAA